MQVNSVNCNTQTNRSNQSFGMAVDNVSKNLVPTEIQALKRSITAINEKYPQLDFDYDAITYHGTKTLREPIAIAKPAAKSIMDKICMGLAKLFGKTFEVESAGPDVATYRIPLQDDMVPSEALITAAQDALMHNTEIAANSYYKKMGLIKNARKEEAQEEKMIYEATNQDACFKQLNQAKKASRVEED